MASSGHIFLGHSISKVGIGPRCPVNAGPASVDPRRNADGANVADGFSVAGEAGSSCGGSDPDDILRDRGFNGRDSLLQL